MYFVLLILTTLGLLYPGPPALRAVVTVALAALLLFGGSGLFHRRPIVHLMIVSCVFAALVSGTPLTLILSKTAPFSITIILILSISLISSLIDAAGSYTLLAKAVGRWKAHHKTNVIMCSAAAASPLLNMATPMIYGPAFSKSSPDDIHTAAVNIKRGMMVAMLFAPTFAPIAMVVGSHPGIVWADTLIYTLPLAFATLVFFLATEKRPLNMPAPANSDPNAENTGLIWVLIYIAVFLFAATSTGLNIIASIILSAELTTIAALIARRAGFGGAALEDVERKCRDSIDKLNNEGLIFICSGIILVSSAHIIRENQALFSFFSSLPAYFLIPFVIMILPLPGMAGAHPIIGFTLIQPMTFVNQELAELQKYLIWVCYWVVSLQISPISVINLTTSHAFGVKAAALTDRGNFSKIYLLGAFYSLSIMTYGVLMT